MSLEDKLTRAVRYISAICYYIYPYLYTITILLLLISLYRLYKKQITYKEIPKFFTILAFIFDIYYVIVYYTPEKNKQWAEKVYNIVFPLLITQLSVEGIVILVYLYNLARCKIYFFIPLVILVGGIIFFVSIFIDSNPFWRLYASLGYSFIYIGAVENEWAIRKSKNGYGIPIEMTISFLIYNLVYLFMLFDHDDFEEICFAGVIAGIGANMDLFFTYVKTINTEIEGTIIKKGENPKEKQKEPSVSSNAINVAEDPLLNNQI